MGRPGAERPGGGGGSEVDVVEGADTEDDSGTIEAGGIIPPLLNSVGLLASGEAVPASGICGRGFTPGGGLCNGIPNAVFSGDDIL